MYLYIYIYYVPTHIQRVPKRISLIILPLYDDTNKTKSVRIAHASGYGQCPTSYLYNRVAHIFQKSRRRLKIVGVRRVTLKQVTC